MPSGGGIHPIKLDVACWTATVAHVWDCIDGPWSSHVYGLSTRDVCSLTKMKSADRLPIKSYDQDACGFQHVVRDAMRDKENYAAKTRRGHFETARDSHVITAKLRSDARL
jgi:hypothetical protein